MIKKTVIFKYKRVNKPNAKLNFIAGHFEKSFGLEQGELKLQTISRILKQSDKILNTDFVSKYRDRRAEHPELEECLYKWFDDQRSHFIPISDDILNFNENDAKILINLRNRISEIAVKKQSEITNYFQKE